MNMGEHRVDEQYAPSAMERALRALSLAMGGGQAESPPMDPKLEEAR